MVYRALFLVALLLVNAAFASGVRAEQDVAVASVNGSPILKSELEAAIRARVVPGFGSRAATDTRAVVLRELIKERLGEQVVSQETIAANPNLSHELDRTRRQILLGFYLNTKLPTRQTSQDDIDRFIKENPRFFSMRKTYHFSEVIVSAPSKEEQERVSSRLRQIIGLRAPQPSTVTALVEWLEANKYRVGYSKLWMSSEQVSPSRLDLLARLDASQDKSSVEVTGDEYKLVVLHAAFADPLDPVRSRSAVAQSIAANARAAAAEAVITDLLASADIRLYDKTVEGLDLPAAKPRPVASRANTVADRLRIATLTSMLCLTPLLITWLMRSHLSRVAEEKLDSISKRVVSFDALALWAVVIG